MLTFLPSCSGYESVITYPLDRGSRSFGPRIYPFRSRRPYIPLQPRHERIAGG
jgi:hypothetical protein